MPLSWATFNRITFFPSLILNSAYVFEHPNNTLPSLLPGIGIQISSQVIKTPSHLDGKAVNYSGQLSYMAKTEKNIEKRP